MGPGWKLFKFCEDCEDKLGKMSTFSGKFQKGGSLKKRHRSLLTEWTPPQIIPPSCKDSLKWKFLLPKVTSGENKEIQWRKLENIPSTFSLVQKPFVLTCYIRKSIKYTKRPVVTSVSHM